MLICLTQPTPREMFILLWFWLEISWFIPQGSEINQFTESDISIFEAFAIFCGLGIHNTQMYENACKLMAKQKVALECLSYHATAPPDLTIKLMQDTIPSAELYSLYSFNFSGMYWFLLLLDIKTKNITPFLSSTRIYVRIGVELNIYFLC